MRCSKAFLVGMMLLLFGSAFGCRAARGTRGMLPSGQVPDFTRAYMGQMRILSGFGEDSRIKLARNEALASGCDAAVLVTSAVLEGSTARFELELIGFPRIEARNSGRECRKAPRRYSLVLTGLDAGAATAEGSEDVDRVLQTPARYLKERGVEFAHEPQTSLGQIADKRLHTTADERTLARAVTKPHRRLLSVAPVRREKRKEMRYQGEVKFVAVIGLDGRLHAPRLVGSYGAHTDRILKVLSLWRYEPALRGDDPVSFRAEERTVFRVF
jgi:hypothetical protein